jgi:hypothetical protein
MANPMDGWGQVGANCGAVSPVFRKPLIGAGPLQRTRLESDQFCGMQGLSDVSILSQPGL